MKTACSLLLFVSFVSPLTAQIFTSSAVTSTPLTLTCAIPGQPPQVDTVPSASPVAPILLVSQLGSPAGTATAVIDGQFQAGEQVVTMAAVESVGATLGGTAVLAPHDYVLVAQATVPTPVQLVVSWLVAHDPGVPLPFAQVDVGDDGTIDFQGAVNAQSLVVQLVIGAAPFRVRMRTAMSALSGSAHATLRCTFTSAFGMTSTLLPGGGCQGFVAPFTTLEHQLGLQMPWSSSPTELNAMVIGYAPLAVPLPLPTACLLGASPDIVVPAPFGAVRIDLQALPPGPLTFFAQGWRFLGASNLVFGTSTAQVDLP